jgi:hypothetical protein
VTESQLQDAIRLELGGRPDLVVVWRNNVGSAVMTGGFRVAFGVGGPGGADLLGIDHRGRFVAIEIKTPIGRLSQEQKRFADLVVRMGGTHLVMRSVDDARAYLAGL